MNKSDFSRKWKKSLAALMIPVLLTGSVLAPVLGSVSFAKESEGYSPFIQKWSDFVFDYSPYLDAVLIVLWKDIKFLFKNPFSKPAKMLYAATIPTILSVLCFKGFFEGSFNGELLPLCFMITALLLIITQVFGKSIRTKKISYKTAITIGIVQGLAVLPGISRSGSTICTGVLCGLDSKNASRFSFLLSIPIILASIFHELLGVITKGAPLFDVGIIPTLIAFVCAFVVGLLCVKFMLTAFQKISLWWFAGYLIILAGVAFVVI